MIVRLALHSHEKQVQPDNHPISGSRKCRLIDPATRLLGLHWRSDNDDWKAIVQTDGIPSEEQQVGTLLGRADWEPHNVAVTMKRYVGYHP